MAFQFFKRQSDSQALLLALLPQQEFVAPRGAGPGQLAAVFRHLRRPARPPDLPDYLREDVGLPPAYHPVQQCDVAMTPQRGLFDNR